MEDPTLTNDIFLIEHKDMYSYIKNFTDTTKDTLIMKNLVSPVKGLHLFTYKNLRSDSLGLWEISIENRQKSFTK
jgi:hypothetical protein